MHLIEAASVRGLIQIPPRRESVRDIVTGADPVLASTRLGRILFWLVTFTMLYILLVFAFWVCLFTDYFIEWSRGRARGERSEMSLYRDEGVVLRTSKLGEADRIITILTRGHGKIRAVAKGVRRTKSRFGARLEPFMRVDVLIAEGRSLDVVSQAEAVAAYGAPIAADYAAYEPPTSSLRLSNKLASTEHEQLPNQYRPASLAR